MTTMKPYICKYRNRAGAGLLICLMMWLTPNTGSAIDPDGAQPTISLVDINTPAGYPGAFSSGQQNAPTTVQPGIRDVKTIRDFALFNYSRLSSDIVNGQGLYLDTLFLLLNVEEGNRAAARRDLIRILVSSHRVPDFAIAVAEYYPAN